MKSKLCFVPAVLFVLLLQGCRKDDNKPSWQWVKSPDNTLAGNYITSLVIDVYGNKWFGTDKGLSVFNDTSWSNYNRSDGTKEHSLINGLSAESDDTVTNIWIATNHGASLLTFDRYCNMIKSADFVMSVVPLASDTVNNLFVDPKNIKWFLTNGGLSVFGSDWHMNVSSSVIFGDGIVISGAFPEDGYKYAGRRIGGMIKFNYSEVDGVTGASEWYYPYNGDILDTVSYVYVSSKGELWLACRGDAVNNPAIGTENFPKDGLMRHVGTDPKNPGNRTYFNTVTGGLVNNRINYITESPDHKIWAGSEGGVSYQIDENSFGNYTMKDGLVNSYVTCIAFDKDGSLWIGTKNGISHLKNNTFENFTAR